MGERAKATTIPSEQRFLSCMAFSVFINEVVRMASLSRSYFVYAPRLRNINKPTLRQALVTRTTS